MGLTPGWRPAAVLLDRDGTLNRKAPEGSYISGPDEVEMLPGAAGAVARLTAAGVRVAVVTNQRGVARGLLPEAAVDSVNQAVGDAVAEAGGRIEHWFVCPHDLGACDCRKPADGLVRRALAAWGLAGRRCAIVGDRESDVQAGVPQGLVRVLIAPGAPPSTVAHAVAPDLPAAVELLLSTAHASSAGPARGLR